MGVWKEHEPRPYTSNQAAVFGTYELTNLRDMALARLSHGILKDNLTCRPAGELLQRYGRGDLITPDLVNSVIVQAGAREIWAEFKVVNGRLLQKATISTNCDALEMTDLTTEAAAVDNDFLLTDRIPLFKHKVAKK